MGLGGVAIAVLPSVVYPKQSFSDRLGGGEYVCLISQGTILIYVFHFAFLPLGGKVLNLFADKTDWFYCILQSLLALIILLLFIKPIELLLHKCPLLLGHYHIKNEFQEKK